MQMYDSATVARFWNLVNIKGLEECWEWQASTRGAGYGQFTLSKPKRVIASAHRLAWEMFNNKKLNNRFEYICHECDNPPCCNSNPGHLYLGDCFTNMLDRDNSGHTGRGKAKLTEDEVLFIRLLWKDRVMTQRAIAKLYSMHKSAIQRIIKRKTWTHI